MSCGSSEHNASMFRFFCCPESPADPPNSEFEGGIVATATKYDLLADEVLRAVGGEHNVKSVTHCATRLRFQLNDRDKADKAAVEATRGVITVVEAGGQFQVVIGNTVNNVYESLDQHGDRRPARTAARGRVPRQGDRPHHQHLHPVPVGAGRHRSAQGAARRGGQGRPDVRRPRRPTRSCSPPPTRSSSSCRSCWRSPRPRSSGANQSHVGGDRRRADLLRHHRGHPRTPTAPPSRCRASPPAAAS